MGEENVEQRIMMSRYWADSSVEWSPVVGPITIGIDEAEGKDQTTFAFKNLGEETFYITTDFDEQALRKVIGLPTITWTSANDITCSSAQEGKTNSITGIMSSDIK